MKKITLSFDNGPTPDVTDHVLDTLDRHGVLSTFFMIGQKLEDAKARETMAKAHAAGH
jgi:peptidoglycan/xylan/chitin deacetylase (PgdA/CDA1 family)